MLLLCSISFYSILLYRIPYNCYDYFLSYLIFLYCISYNLIISYLILSYLILSYLILFSLSLCHIIILCYTQLFPILPYFNPILSYPILSYLFLSYPISMFPVKYHFVSRSSILFLHLKHLRSLKFQVNVTL